MISPSQKDVVVQIVGYGILLYLLCVSLLRFARFARNLSFTKCTFNPMRWWRQGGDTVEKDDGKLAERVSREVGETCSAFTLTVAKAMLVMSLVTLVAMIRNMRSGQTRFMNVWQDLFFIVFTLAVTIMATVPCLVRPKTLALWYSIVMLCISVGVVTSETYEDALFTSSFWMLPRVAFAVAHGQVAVATFWNVVCLSCSFYSYLNRGNISNEQGIDNSSLNRRTLTLEIMYFCVVVFGTFLAKRALRAYVRSVEQTKTLTGESSAMKELLHLLCDISVELDSDLAFVENDSKFAAFLTQAPSREIKGRPFKEFIPDTPERDAFDDRMRSSGENSSQPGALHTSLRDGWGNHINVEVFFVQFDSADMTKHYFVGCREFDNAPLADLRETAPRGRGSTLRGQQHGPGAAQGAGTPAVVNRRSSDDDASSEKSAGSASSKGSKSRGGELALPQARATNELAMQISLVSLLKTWNVQRRAVICCPLHAQLQWAQRACKSIASGRCQQGFQVSARGQCAMCGILEPDESQGTCPNCLMGQLEAVQERATVSL